jgi:hypothetical protein
MAMEKIEGILNRLKEDFGKRLNALKNLKVEPLRRIPEPPEIYKSWKAMIRGIEDRPDLLDQKRRMLNKELEGATKEVKKYEYLLGKINDQNGAWAELALVLDQISFIGEGITPIEKIEIKEADYKKHGGVQWMLVTGFEFWRVEEIMKNKKIYFPLNPEAKKYDIMKALMEEKKQEGLTSTLPFVRNGKMAAAGEEVEEKGYPRSWDQPPLNDVETSPTLENISGGPIEIDDF